MRTFGLAHFKAEGMPLHPDDIEGPMPAEQRQRQLEAYNKAFAHVLPEDPAEEH